MTVSLSNLKYIYDSVSHVILTTIFSLQMYVHIAMYARRIYRIFSGREGDRVFFFFYRSPSLLSVLKGVYGGTFWSRGNADASSRTPARRRNSNARRRLN